MNGTPPTSLRHSPDSPTSLSPSQEPPSSLRYNLEPPKFLQTRDAKFSPKVNTGATPHHQKEEKCRHNTGISEQIPAYYQHNKLNQNFQFKICTNSAVAVGCR